MQVQTVYWNVYIHNQLLQKALAGKIKLNPYFKEIWINVERTYNQTEDPIKLAIFKKSYLFVNSWFQRDKYFQKDLDPIQQEQMIVFSATDPLFRAILLERDLALQQNVTRRFYIKNMYIGTEYDGSVFGPSANTTYKGLTNPISCPSGKVYDSRCRYWFNDTIHHNNISSYISPPQLQYSNVGIPFLASVFCQRIELPPYTELKQPYATLDKQGNLYSVLCNNLDLTAAGVYFSSFNQKSAFKMLIDPSSQIAVYYSLFQLNSTQQQQTLSSLELNPRTTNEQAQLFEQRLHSLYSNPILDVKENIDMVQINDGSYQQGFTFYRLNNPPNIDQNPLNQNLQQQSPLKNQTSQQQQDEEKQENLKEHYAILNSIQTIQKLKDPWSGGYSINTAFILIDVLSKDMLTVQAKQMQELINEYNHYSQLVISIFFSIVIILVIIRFIRIFKLIISPINQLTNILKSVSLEDENQISYILGDKQLALESLFEKEIFLSEDTKILYESIVSLFKMVQYTQSNIFVQTESQTLLNLNQQITHFQKFQNPRALGICHNNIGYIHFNAHRYQEALQEFQQAIIYSNYEVKIYEDELKQSQMNNSNLLVSEVTRNIKLLSNYKNIINQIQKKTSAEKEEKIFRKSAFSSGTSLLNNKKLQKMKQQSKKEEKLDKEQIIHYEVQSENSLSQLQLQSNELQKQQNNLIENNAYENKKLEIQECEIEVNQENVQSPKLFNSQQLYSSNSLSKKKHIDNQIHKSESNSKQISMQKDKSLTNSLNNKQEQNFDRKKNITESLSPSRSTTSKAANQDNEITNLFFCLYSRKFNYAKTLFMLLERQNSNLANMWIELEQLLLEVIDIGNQMTFVNQIKSFQFSCYIYLISLAKKLNNQIKLAEYMRCSYEILQEILNDQIQQDIYQEIRLNSNRTLRSEADNQTIIYTDQLLKNRDFLNNYLQSLILKTQLLSQWDINSTYLLDTQKMLPSQKISTFQSFNQQSQFPDQNQTITRLLTQLINSSSFNQRSTSVSEYQKKLQSQNKLNSQNTLQNLQFSNISNINYNNEKSPLMHVLSPYRNKNKSMFKKNESFNTSTNYKQVQINQISIQKSQVYFKKRASKAINERSPVNPSSKQNKENQQISQKLQIKNEEKNLQNFPKSLTNLLSKQKQITKNVSSKSSNKLSKIKMHVRQVSQSNNEVFEKQLKDTIQKIIKKKVKKQESKEITGIYMPNLGSSSFCRNSNNYQQPDLLIQKMVFIEASLLYQNQKYLETVNLLTQQLENEYYYDPTNRHRFLLIIYKILSKLKIEIPEQLKSMISCYNKGILYKIGLLSLCKSKKNRYKTFILTKQILSTIMVKPQDQFSLLVFKKNMFHNLFQQISQVQINQIKDSIEEQLMQIFEDDQHISPKQFLNELQNVAPSLMSSNQQQFNQVQVPQQNNQQPTQQNQNFLAKKILVQKTPFLFKGPGQKQNQNHQNDGNLLNNQSNENFNIQSFQFLQDSSYAKVLQSNQSNLQLPFANKTKGDAFSFQPTNNQNSFQDSNMTLQNQFQSTNNFQNNLNILQAKKNSLINDSNLFQLNQQYFQSMINFTDQKKETLRDNDEIEELKYNIKEQPQQEQSNYFDQNYDGQNVSNNKQNVNLQQDQNQNEFKHKQSQSSFQEQYQFGRISEFQSQIDSNTSHSSDSVSVNENILALKNLEDEIQSEENTFLQNTNDIISIEEQLIRGVNRIILSHFYQDNYNLLHGKMQTEEQKLNQINLKTQKNSEQFDKDCFNYLNIKKFIICVTDSLQIIDKTQQYQDMIKLLYKLNTELLILQLNQQSHFEETNYPSYDCFNNQQVIQLFYSEQKLLQYLYNNRHNQNYLYLPLTVEYFQTNFVFVFIF